MLTSRRRSKRTGGSRCASIIFVNESDGEEISGEAGSSVSAERFPRKEAEKGREAEDEESSEDEFERGVRLDQAAKDDLQ